MSNVFLSISLILIFKPYWSLKPTFQNIIDQQLWTQHETMSIKRIFKKYNKEQKFKLNICLQHNTLCSHLSYYFFYRILTKMQLWSSENF